MKLGRKIMTKLHDIFYKIRYYNLYRRNIRIRDKSYVYIDSTAEVDVKYKMRFNQPQSEQFAYGNPYPGHLYIGHKSCVKINNVSFVSGARLTIEERAKFTWESGYINMHCNIICCNEINIGKDVIIGEQVRIQDTNYHYIMRDGYKVSAPINIEDHVWIGSQVIILPGVTIGTGSMIAAGSVVTHSIPSHSLAAGNPAKIIKEGIKWKW